MSDEPYQSDTQQHTLRCPSCGEYSLTYDWPRNGYFCHVYAGFIPSERKHQ